MTHALSSSVSVGGGRGGEQTDFDGEVFKTPPPPKDPIFHHII